MFYNGFFFPVAPEKEMYSTVKLTEKREHAGEQEKDKSKARSKKPTSAVSMPCVPWCLTQLQVLLGFSGGCSDVSCHSCHSKICCVFLITWLKLNSVCA